MNKASVSVENNEDSVRQRIQHEVDLINTRLTWLLTFQGFLFAAVSLATGKSRRALVDVVPWIGIAVAVLSFFGILAAYFTIDSIRSENPTVAFGASKAKWRKLLGRANSLGIPIVVTSAWVVLYFKLS